MSEALRINVFREKSDAGDDTLNMKPLRAIWFAYKSVKKGWAVTLTPVIWWK